MQKNLEKTEVQGRESYTNLNYIYQEEGLTIECDIGQNMQGDGRLSVKHLGRVVFNISNSYPEGNRKDLPVVTAHSVEHNVVVYEPGEWEKRIIDLASS